MLFKPTGNKNQNHSLILDREIRFGDFQRMLDITKKDIKNREMRPMEMIGLIFVSLPPTWQIQKISIANS
ncbi:hypothetical protein P872_08610 [Rhodonellum psychrophilum GCM71 = DSM 17998]|uniref:Uncharacterized protein n=1 Tax=Rhodonellum psychrophilum GCM71 = DSM 17998 TaxID=1123057 RepID=U5BNB1_9BACT|nr:hypothetical protein P872_08610 [Rhodonellum psychrophilum GCM71 = DSM 17998]